MVNGGPLQGDKLQCSQDIHIYTEHVKVDQHNVLQCLIFKAFKLNKNIQQQSKKKEEEKMVQLYSNILIQLCIQPQHPLNLIKLQNKTEQSVHLVYKLVCYVISFRWTNIVVLSFRFPFCWFKTHEIAAAAVAAAIITIIIECVSCKYVLSKGRK